MTPSAVQTAISTPGRIARRLGSLVRRFRADPADAWRRIRVRGRMAVLRADVRFNPRSLLGDTPVVVNVTTFGRRASLAFYALDSIGLGSVRPARLVLWLDDPGLLADPPRELRRLQRRGLELLPCNDYGPHNKQFPYATSIGAHTMPLVVADDDILYPRRWLAELVDAWQERPDVVSCHRAHLIALDENGIRPYLEWTPRVGTATSLRVFPTGVSGVLYPPGLLNELSAAGEAFMQKAPRADDVWVHAVAVSAGIPTRQIHHRQAHYPAVPGTQLGTLFRVNVREGGNDRQIAQTYSPALVDLLVKDLETP